MSSQKLPEKIRIKTGYDGSCPNSKEGIKQENNNVFTILPSYREEEGISEEGKGKGFRLGIEVINDTKEKADVYLNIEWEDKENKYMKYRDYVFIKNENNDEWSIIPSEVEGSVSRVKLENLTGRTKVYLNPRYNYTDNERFVERMSNNKLVKKEKVGESEENRNIWSLNIGDGDTKVLIMARNHAYESAGNWCIEGMVDWLFSDDLLAKYLINQFRFYFLPMTNPDGVYNGMSRLTSPKGVDINRVITAPDKAHFALMNFLDRVKPHLFINIHNWMDKFKDGLLCFNSEFAESIIYYMPGQIECGKRWYIEDWQEYCRKNMAYTIPEISRSWKDYCEERFGSIGIVFEFPWWGRNIKVMKETGIKALKSSLFTWMNYIK